jgi:hypothetical protein
MLSSHGMTSSWHDARCFPKVSKSTPPKTNDGGAFSTHAVLSFAISNHPNPRKHLIAYKNPSDNTDTIPFANMSLSNKLSITDIDLKDKRVLIRVSNSCSPTPRNCMRQRINTDDTFAMYRSTSTSLSMAIRKLQTTSVSLEPSQQSNMPLTMEQRQSSSCPTSVAQTASPTQNTP